MDFNLRIITLPAEAGKDPDEAVRKDPQLWKQAIKDALPVVDWLYRNAFRCHDASKPEDKKLIAKELLAEFLRIPDAVERDAWIVRLAKDLGVSDQALREAMRGVRGVKPETRSAKPDASSSKLHASRSAKSRASELEERMWSALYLKPELEGLAKSILKDYYLAAASDDDLLNYLAILADREFQDQSLEALQCDLERTCCDLRELKLNAARTRLEQDMREAERAGDQGRISELSAEFNILKE